MSEVTRAVEFLTSSELSHVRPEEKLHLIFNKASHSVSPRDFVKSVMTETLRRLPKEFGSETSFFTTHALSVPESALVELRREFKAMVEKFISLSPFSCQFFAID